jgi:hypothetical protein
MAAHTCNPSTWEAKAEGLENLLYIELKNSLATQWDLSQKKKKEKKLETTIDNVMKSEKGTILSSKMFLN